MIESRTKNAFRNIFFGFVNKIVVLLLPFALRTIMIKYLGVEYLGLNSLFTSILQVLNLAELGFSSAVVYSMYKPIAEKDKDAICALLNLYKKIYRIIGIFIFLTGLLCLPFLKYLIKGNFPGDINIYLLFILFLINTVLTYLLFAYKSSLLQAHQRNDIFSNILTLTKLFQFILQIVVLVIFKNYYLFVIISILSTIINNILFEIITNKKYPEYRSYGDVSKSLKTEIKTRVTGLMIQKVCSTTRNSLDSIFISAFLGLSVVTLYSNYYTIMNAVLEFIGIISSAILAGVGNSIVTESIKKNYNDMNKFNFIYMWIAGVCTICLGCLYQPFIKLWMGKDFLLPTSFVILMCLYFYALKMGDIRSLYSDAKGLWWENRYRAIAESIANILLNFILVKVFGLYGIVIGTLISLLIINFGYGSQILFKYYFRDEKISQYYIRHLLYFIVTSIVFVITNYFCTLIIIDGFLGFVIKALACVSISNLLYFCFYCKDRLFIESKSFFLNIIRKVL